MIVTVTHLIPAEKFRAWCRGQGYPDVAQGTTVQMEEWIRLIVREAIDVFVAEATVEPSTPELNTPPPPMRVKVRRR